MSSPYIADHDLRQIFRSGNWNCKRVKSLPSFVKETRRTWPSTWEKIILSLNDGDQKEKLESMVLIV